MRRLQASKTIICTCKILHFVPLVLTKNGHFKVCMYTHMYKYFHAMFSVCLLPVLLSFDSSSPSQPFFIFPSLHFLIFIFSTIQPAIGDCVFYIENGRPAAELAAAIWLTYRRKYKRSLPVKVTEEITYSRPGVKEGMESQNVIPLGLFLSVLYILFGLC